MIHGIGVDLIRIERIEEVLQRHGDRFVQRLLHPAELEAVAAAASRANFVAKSWAVKEAFGKALGTGVRGYANPEVGVERREHGKPYLVYSDAMSRRLAAEGIVGGHVSITDEAGMVMAFVVLERA
jgi:holo-[acyl-carrier protein] synthase